MKSYPGMKEAMGSSKDDPMDEEDMADGGADEDTEDHKDDLPPEFETAATEAFPELADDPDRLHAFYSAIEACHGGGHSGLAILLGGPKGKK